MTLQHVSLEVPPAGADAEEAFWALLGFRALEVPDALAERARWVGPGDGTQVHLLLAEDAVAPPQGHVAVVVADFEAAVEALRGAGLAVDPRAEHWGAARAFVRSPAGHRVELMAAPPPSRPAQPPPSSR
jgi:catechol 2,3-dioxygenase-like lactoylglutathione lyase family enzyme